MSEELVNLFQFAQIQELVSAGQVPSSEKEVDSLPTLESLAVEDADMTATYHDIMTEDYESNDTRIACIGNVDSGKVKLIPIHHFNCD
jgi:polynucleotide 5'-kinase involved in rRNA processing